MPILQHSLSHAHAHTYTQISISARQTFFIFTTKSVSTIINYELRRFPANANFRQRLTMGLCTPARSLTGWLADSFADLAHAKTLSLDDFSGLTITKANPITNG